MLRCRAVWGGVGFRVVGPADTKTETVRPCRADLDLATPDVGRAASSPVRRLCGGSAVMTVRAAGVSQ